MCYFTKCLHLGNSINATGTQKSLINNAIADLNIKSNNLLAEFSFCNSSTLSVLFKSNCMTVRLCGDTTIIQILTIFVFHGGKLLDDYGRQPIKLIIG